MDAWVSWAIGPPWRTPPGRLGDEVAFDVIRDGATTTLDVRLGRFPLERFGGAPISLIVFGAGVLVLALILMLRRTRATALRLLFVGAAANVADIVAWEVGLQPTDFGLPGPMLLVFGAASLFNIVFWATIVHILVLYPVRSPLAGRPAVIPALRWPAARVLRARGGGLARGRHHPRPGGPARRLHSRRVGMLVLIIARRSPDIAARRRRRRQVRWIAATMLFAAGATLALLTLPIVLNGHPLVPRATVSFLVCRSRSLAVAVIRTGSSRSACSPGAASRSPPARRRRKLRGASRRAGADAGRRRDQA